MLILVSQDVATGIDLDSIKAHLAIEHDQDDERIAELITEAVDLIETETGLRFLDSTYDLYLSGMPFAVGLPGNVVEVVSVKYYDRSNEFQIWNDWEAYLPDNGEAVVLMGSCVETADRPDAVQVRFVTSNASPKFVAAVKVYVAMRNENREGQEKDTRGFDRLVNSLKTGVYR